MLLGVINAKNIDQYEVLYFEFPIDLVEKDNSVFTDASANTAVPPNFFFDCADLDKLDWDAIDSLKWGSPDDAFRHRRMAELLVHRKLPLTAASCCVVWNKDVKREVEKIVAKTCAEFPPIVFEDPDRRHWFTNFQAGKKNSCVIGPQEIADTFEAGSAYLIENCGKHSDAAPFQNLTKLLQGLQANFGCISHAAELVGLESANGIHKHTVDVHTKDVVTKLLALPRYAKLEPKQKKSVEIAAYLHEVKDLSPGGQTMAVFKKSTPIILLGQSL
jgi:ssDNA thymidine ADP-ribosyltransferase, DarT